MSRTAALRTRSRRALALTIMVLIVVAAAIIGALVHESASSAARTLSDVPHPDLGRSVIEPDGVVNEADGALPDGVTVFDDEYPGVANLDPDLLQALRDAATEAADEGIEFHVNSGWRSPEYQDQLLLEAVSEYGTEAEAARWVATADTSAHVAGHGIDLGPFEATAWLSQYGAEYGLCQIYGNESWHYELRAEAIGSGCPPMYADPSQDPRMQR